MKFDILRDATPHPHHLADETNMTTQMVSNWCVTQIATFGRKKKYNMNNIWDAAKDHKLVVEDVQRGWMSMCGVFVVEHSPL
eukprot:CAMPEP_0113852780 /NCGR_PEP_ID=MMETSP0372-20130328/5800_1 /TAXON_ID=340204 /ORGANISM="Lankesteria abbotti" /LENGTH=81 /DNA_ID=CAMNT_0000824567 /DNA_START=56 /DNA_END=304 /DNA_ORIENTATION=+ /assembly_acc=CAM_ASM_000359